MTQSGEGPFISQDQKEVDSPVETGDGLAAADTPALPAPALSWTELVRYLSLAEEQKEEIRALLSREADPIQKALLEEFAETVRRRGMIAGLMEADGDSSHQALHAKAEFLGMMLYASDLVHRDLGALEKINQSLNAGRLFGGDEMLRLVTQRLQGALEAELSFVVPLVDEEFADRNPTLDTHLLRGILKSWFALSALKGGGIGDWFLSVPREIADLQDHEWYRRDVKLVQALRSYGAAAWPYSSPGSEMSKQLLQLLESIHSPKEQLNLIKALLTKTEILNLDDLMLVVANIPVGEDWGAAVPLLDYHGESVKFCDNPDVFISSDLQILSLAMNKTNDPAGRGDFELLAQQIRHLVRHSHTYRSAGEDAKGKLESHFVNEHSALILRMMEPQRRGAAPPG